MADSPFPPGTDVQIIYVDAEGEVLPAKADGSAPAGTVGGETVVTYPDGRVETSLFRLDEG